MTRKFYEAARESLADAMPNYISSGLKRANKDYAEFKTFEQAGAYLRAQEGRAIVDPRQLQSAVKAVNDPRQTTIGEGLLQPEAQMATDTIARALPGRSQIDTAKDLTHRPETCIE